MADLKQICLSVQDGHRYVSDDAQLVEALAQSLNVTLKLELNDLVLVEEAENEFRVISGPWLGCVTDKKRDAPKNVIVSIILLDLLGNKKLDSDELSSYNIYETDKITVLRRRGNPIFPKTLSESTY